ncbi:MAG: hypothetical protein A2451_01275, partial [Bdellovibrionales bacterium RIFOXYC2_FULL_39_8]
LFMDDAECTKATSFFVTAKRLLEKTYYELFEYRAIMKRRKPDYVLALSDRLFLIQFGVAILVKDTIKQIKFLKHGGQPPKLMEISKNVFQNNPCFKNIFGIFLFPSGVLNDIINIMPGMFIIGGIFGTFLGIMQALPTLGGMDLQDVEGTKRIMDGFLVSMAFSMGTSIIGILLSVGMTFVNTTFNPEKLFVSIVDRFENCLDMLWNRSTDNQLPSEIPNFDEHRDPLEALAEEAVRNQLSKSKEKITYDTGRMHSLPEDTDHSSISEDGHLSEMSDLSSFTAPLRTSTDEKKNDINKKAS